MKALSASLVALTIGLAGCTTEIPVTTSFPRMSQLQMQGAMHWDAVAADVATRLADALNPDRDQRVVLYVEPEVPGSAFSRTFHELLETELLQSGFGITQNRGQGLPLTYKVQLLSYADRGTPPMGRGSYADNEVVITAAITSGDRYITRISDVYYVNDNNTRHYAAVFVPSSRLIEVVGDEE